MRRVDTGFVCQRVRVLFPSCCGASDEDTMEIVSDANTLPSIVRMMADPTQSREVMTSCLSTLSEISKTPGTVEVIAGTDALTLTLHYLDDNMFDLPKEVGRQAGLPVALRSWLVSLWCVGRVRV